MSLKIVGKSDGGINIYRQTWDGGDWWEFFGSQPWKVTRLLRRTLAALDVETDAQKMAEVSRTIRLEYGTTAWSWDIPVTADGIDEIPSVRVIEISRVMAELHVASDMNSVGEEQKKALSGHSSWVRKLRSFGWMSTITGRRSEQGFWHRWVKKNLTNNQRGGSTS